MYMEGAQMGQNDIKAFNKKIRTLSKYIFKDSDIDIYRERLDESFDRKTLDIPYAIFISLCNTKTRAHICHGAGETLTLAWDNAVTAAKAWLKKNDIEPVWVKLEIVSYAKAYPINKGVDEMFSSYAYFFRKGISFDRKFRYSFTEGEINGNKLLDYKKKCFDMRMFNAYLMKRDDDVMLSAPREFIFFECNQYFIDEKNDVYTLYPKGLECGRRIPGELGRQEIMRLIVTSSGYLAKQVKLDGKFEYGFYPLNHYAIPTYNILRHTSSIWSMLCASEISHDKDMYNKAVLALKYMTGQIEHYDGYSYLIEKNSNEIKLGATAVAIILLIQYMKLEGSEEYKELCIKLGEGVLRMMDRESGKFVHVLNYPDQSLKDEYRIIYYDGEAAFALAKLYGLTGERKWLEASQTAVEHFIEADYTRHRDHWVAYAVNELTLYLPEERYFEFGLRNVQVNLKGIFEQPTSYHTYMEVLMAAFEMYDRILQKGYSVSYMEEFDQKYFLETIAHRAYHMLSGYAYPEYVMYFLKPRYFKGSFFIRHDAYRTRIDDVQHFCSAYIAFYNRYDDIINRYKELMEKEK